MKYKTKVADKQVYFEEYCRDMEVVSISELTFIAEN